MAKLYTIQINSADPTSKITIRDTDRVSRGAMDGWFSGEFLVRFAVILSEQLEQGPTTKRALYEAVTGRAFNRAAHANKFRFLLREVERRLSSSHTSLVCDYRGIRLVFNDRDALSEAHAIEREVTTARIRSRNTAMMLASKSSPRQHVLSSRPN